MRISSLRYKPIEGGTLGGHFAIHVRLGADDDPESFFLDEDAIARKIHDAFDKLKISSAIVKGVLFDVREVPSIDAGVMSSLISTLRDWNYFVGAWVSDGKRYSWFSLLNYITVFVEKPFWANFKVNEIRFIPASEYIEPEVYDVNAGASCYIQSQDNQRVLAFATGAKRPWGIVVPLRSYPVVDFPIVE